MWQGQADVSRINALEARRFLSLSDRKICNLSLLPRSPSARLSPSGLSPHSHCSHLFQFNPPPSLFFCLFLLCSPLRKKTKISTHEREAASISERRCRWTGRKLPRPHPLSCPSHSSSFCPPTSPLPPHPGIHAVWVDVNEGHTLADEEKKKSQTHGRCSAAHVTTAARLSVSKCVQLCRQEESDAAGKTAQAICFTW